MECTQVTTQMEMEAVITSLSPSTNIKINKCQTEFSLVKILKDKAVVETELRRQKPLLFVPLLPPPFLTDMC